MHSNLSFIIFFLVKWIDFLILNQSVHVFMKFCCYQIWQGNYCASVIVNFEERSVCNFVYRYGWPSVCGLTRNFQEVQFLEIKKKGKKKTQKNNNCKMCLYEKSRWIYSLYAFLKSLKIQKSQHGKIYLHVRELDAMVWRTLHDHIFTSFLLKKKQLEFKHHQNTFFLFNVFAFFC